MAASKLDEFIKLFQEKRTWYVKDIENKLGVSRQSVYRYRDQLYTQRNISLDSSTRDDDGSLLEHDTLEKGYLRWPEASEVINDVNLTLTKDQLEALKTAVAQTTHLTPLLQSALSSLGKASSVKKQLQKEPIIYNPQADQYNPELFQKISKAILERRIASVSYENAKGQETSYKFNAYKLISSDNHLHLVGVSHNSLAAGFNHPIRLRLDRITQFDFLFSKKRNEMYFKNPNFNAKEYAHKEFGAFSSEGEAKSIKVAFSQEKAHYIKRTKRHPSQTVNLQEDGTALWQITAPLSQDLIFWITSYGPHAKVIEPQELKEQVKDWAKGSYDANS